MARIGQNPNRFKPAPTKVSEIVLTCVTHLPNFEGYHAKRFEVVKKSLTSMRENSGGDFTTIVWDNESCVELRDWIENSYKPDIFIKSKNIGKGSARAALFGMLNPYTIVNFSDDDIYHYPSWLMPQVKLLKHFPEVSSVTGYPVRTAFQWGIENTIERLKPTYGRFLPEEWEIDYARSIGIDIDKHLLSTSQDNDIIVEHEGVKAYATSHHCQQVGRAGILRDSARLIITHACIPNERLYDTMLDRMGNRLATLERLTRHMGNVIDDDLRADIKNAEAPHLLTRVVKT